MSDLTSSKPSCFKTWPDFDSQRKETKAKAKGKEAIQSACDMLKAPMFCVNYPRQSSRYAPFQGNRLRSSFNCPPEAIRTTAIGPPGCEIRSRSPSSATVSPLFLWVGVCFSFQVGVDVSNPFRETFPATSGLPQAICFWKLRLTP